MARYKLDDKIVDTDKAQQRWEEAGDHDGRNWISRATGSQWTHETLYLSRKGQYYIASTSQWQGSLPYASWITREEATHWLLLMEQELPGDLLNLEDDIVE